MCTSLTISQGVFIHFSEEIVNNSTPPSTYALGMGTHHSPQLYSCNALNSIGIVWYKCHGRIYGDRHLYSSARQRGSLSCEYFLIVDAMKSLTEPIAPQVLYSLLSVACIINPEYVDPAASNHVFDIFSTQSLTSAHLIENQFDQLLPQNQL